jgi:MerR family redox-sensitive transcriptional activator SoxR
MKSHRDLSIGEVARRAGLQTSAIRYYESEKLLPRPRRESGRRVYGEEVFDRLAVIALGRRAGFTIAELRRLLGGMSGREPGAAWRELTATKLSELDARIAELERMKQMLAVVAACRCPTLSDCGRALRG